MTRAIPPELLAPEQREARMQELRDLIARQWVRYAIVEGLLLGLPIIIGVVLWSAERIPDTTALVLFFVAGALVVAHIAYTMLRMRPWREELARLERVEGVGGT
jgi:membrane protein YdbS with pleckstrin-like domain